MFYRKERILRVPTVQNYIIGLFYGRGRIKKQYHDESSTEESESECVLKNINKGKDANNESDHEEPMVTNDIIVVKDPIHFNIFVCRKNCLNSIDATCERACMSTQIDKYYMEL